MVTALFKDSKAVATQTVLTPSVLNAKTAKTVTPSTITMYRFRLSAKSSPACRIGVMSLIEEKRSPFISGPMDCASVEEHPSLTDRIERLLDLEVAEHNVPGSVCFSARFGMGRPFDHRWKGVGSAFAVPIVIEPAALTQYFRRAFPESHESRRRSSGRRAGPRNRIRAK